jgi:hypothetical protein
LFLGQALSAHAEDASSYIYKVTSYNLGALIDPGNPERLRIAQDSSPLLIANSAADIFTSKLGPSLPGETAANRPSGMSVSASFDATSKISLQGAFGITRHLWAPDSINYENEKSWEANLGIIYKLLDHLHYELHFGYMETGDSITDRNSFTDVENIIMISNKLSMSF